MTYTKNITKIKNEDKVTYIMKEKNIKNKFLKLNLKYFII
jgi:hypothetical protein